MRTQDSKANGKRNAQQEKIDNRERKQLGERLYREENAEKEGQPKEAYQSHGDSIDDPFRLLALDLGGHTPIAVHLGQHQAPHHHEKQQDTQGRKVGKGIERRVGEKAHRSPKHHCSDQKPPRPMWDKMAIWKEIKEEGEADIPKEHHPF